jgi:hypothetical protein
MSNCPLELILVPRASWPSATFIVPGIHATGSARKPVVEFLKRILLTWIGTLQKPYNNLKILLNLCEIAVIWEANHISRFSRLTLSLIFNEWPSENGSGNENGSSLVGSNAMPRWKDSSYELPGTWYSFKIP